MSEGESLLMHWTGTPQGECARKDSRVDRKLYLDGNGGMTVTCDETRFHLQITCTVCAEYEWQHWQRERSFPRRRHAHSRATPRI